jgi:hypothetical protein
MLIGGLLKVIVHRPGWVRSALNCAFACSPPRCVALDGVIIFSSLVKNLTLAIGSPSELHGESRAHIVRAAAQLELA